jgi:antibiotic biosynthesis monooxygenase (ABM) superfamily enzyme
MYEICCVWKILCINFVMYTLCSAETLLHVKFCRIQTFFHINFLHINLVMINLLLYFVMYIFEVTNFDTDPS